MPTTINILSKTVKQRAFNAPPKFITTERQAYFELTPDAQKYLRTLRTVDNKLNFIKISLCFIFKYIHNDSPHNLIT